MYTIHMPLDTHFWYQIIDPAQVYTELLRYKPLRQFGEAAL